MASLSSTAEQPQADSRPFYCHHCSHQWMKTANSQYECPQCGEGFIEEVTADFQPNPAEQLPVGLFQRSPFLNLLFYQSDMELDQDPAENTRRRIPRQTARARRGRQQASRSRSPHVSLLVESNNGNAFRIGINPGARAASANRILSVAIDDIMDQFFVPGLHPRPPAMTDEQLQEIPKITISEEQVRNELMCSVCFDDFQTNESEVRKLQCGHIFHEKCIFPWLKTNASCPVCRTKMSNATQREEDNDDEDFEAAASLLRVLSEFNRREERRARASNPPPHPNRTRRSHVELSASSSDEGEATNDAAPAPPAAQPAVQAPIGRRVRESLNPNSPAVIRRRPLSWVDTPMNLLSQRSTRSRRFEPVNLTRSPAFNARAEPSTSAAAAAMQVEPSPPTTSSSSSAMGFGSESYRAARVARISARNRIAEMANSSNTRRPNSSTNASVSTFSPVRFARRRAYQHIDSPVPHLGSQIPRPIRAVRMNPTIAQVSDTSNDNGNTAIRSPQSESLSSLSPFSSVMSTDSDSSIALRSRSESLDSRPSTPQSPATRAERSGEASTRPTVPSPPTRQPTRSNRFSRRQLEVAFRGFPN